MAMDHGIPAPLPKKDLQLTDFIKQLIEHLLSNNFQKAKAMIRDKNNIQAIQDNIWGIIPLVTKYINQKTMHEKSELYECCVKIMKNIAKSGDPDDLIICIIREIIDTKDDETFLSMLKPLQTSILRLEEKKRNYLNWSLNAIYIYMEGLVLPENHNLEDEERLLMDADPNVERISVVYFELLPFYDPLVEKFINCNNTEDVECKTSLVKYMIQLLGIPLAYLDMELRKNRKSRARRVAEKLIENITKLNPDFYSCLEYRNEKSDDIIIKDLALGIFYYLCLHEKICFENAPKVYNSVYIFQTCLHYSTSLLSEDNQFCIESGLKLSETLVDSVKSYELSYQLLDSSAHCKFCKILTKIMIYNPILENRNKSLKIFNTYLYLFDARGRYLLIYNLMTILDSVNVKGHLIIQYKEMLASELQKNGKNLSKYYTSEKFYILTKIFCHLPNDEETDLVQYSDQIIAALNFLRFVTIRDSSNITKIWDHIKDIEESFLSLLKKGISLSRMHYQMGIKKIISDFDRGDESPSIPIMINNEELKHLSHDNKIKVMNSSLTALDVMDSLLCHLNEIIEKHRT